ncbi:MAG: FKBP-type peptidyl-prolyl cis-trans isomerase [Pseudomonadota bacterium]
MIYSATQSPVTVHPQAPLAVSEKTYPVLAETTDMERWKRAIDPDYAARMNCSLDTPRTPTGIAFKVVEDAPGAGDGAACGSPVTVQLTVWNATGGKAYDGPVTLNLGSRDVASGFDYGLLGIKPGGVRTLILPPSAMSRAKATKVDKALLAALPVTKLAVVSVTRLK